MAATAEQANWMTLPSDLSTRVFWHDSHGLSNLLRCQIVIHTDRITNTYYVNTGETYCNNAWFMQDQNVEQSLCVTPGFPKAKCNVNTRKYPCGKSNTS